MKYKRGIILFGMIEILIGVITLTTVILSFLQEESTKPPAVLIFVLTTAIISTGLGLGILRYNRVGYYLLLYFASIIILNKILIFAGIISLAGALETAIPSYLKNIISVLYHGLLILYFTRKSIREQFL